MQHSRIARIDVARHTALALRSLSRYGRLSPDDDAAIRALIGDAEVHPAGTELIAEGALLNRPMVLLSGWAARLRILSDGRRQIFNFLVPGDGFGFCARPRAYSLTSTVAITGATVATAKPLIAALQRTDAQDGMMLSAWNMLSLDDSYLFNHLVRVGRQTAYERVAHLLLELYHRLKAVGFVHGTNFSVPLTQEVLADALGLSVVHTNRTLQQLRRDHLIEMRGPAVNLLQPDLLAEIADYRPPPRLAEPDRTADQ